MRLLLSLASLAMVSAVVRPFLHHSFGSAENVMSTMKTFPDMDIEARMAEASTMNNTKAFLHAQVNDVDINFMKEATMTKMDHGVLYSMTFSMDNALSFAFHFDQFWVPEGAAVHFLAAHDSFGSLDHRNRWSQGNQMTRHIDGNVVEIQYFTTVEDEPKLHLNKVTTGFRVLRAGACNIQTICKHDRDMSCSACDRRSTSCSVQCTNRFDNADQPTAEKWADDEWDGVSRAAIGLGSSFGSLYCSGTFINSQRGAQYVLTAHHCGPGASDIIMALYSDPDCRSTSNSNGPRDNVVGDITVIDRDSSIDHALIELGESIPAQWNVYMSGYDNTEDVIPEVLSIHHPSGSNKKISHCGSQLNKASWSGGGTLDHWRCEEWDVATTEPGSSGSGIFDIRTQRLLGQLHGGTASCPAFNGWDSYGGIFASLARPEMLAALGSGSMDGGPLNR